MYRCHFCKELSRPGESRRLVVTQTRVRRYLLEGGREPALGTEIVEEKPSCPPCAGVARPAATAPEALTAPMIAMTDLEALEASAALGETRAQMGCTTKIGEEL